MTEPGRRGERPLAAFRDEIPSLAEGELHLTHAALAVLPRRAVDAMSGYLETRGRGIVSYADVRPRLEACRRHAAELLHAESDEIALTGSTAEGANLVANGLSWKTGDNVISADIEFPDNVYAWSYLERKGVEIRRVATRGGRLHIEDVASAIDGRTRLVALSLVQFVSGFRLDLDRLSRLCRERDVRLFLDAMQGLGAVRVDVRATPVDYLAVGGYKWLLGPMGTGLFYCRRDRLDELEVTSVGSGSMVEPKTYFPYRHDFRPEAARFEGSATRNFVGLFGLGASLELLLEAGPERIEARVLELTATLAEELCRRGYRLRSPFEHDGERSGILCFDHPERSTAELMQALAAARVHVTSVEGRIRVAPHFFHLEDDLERLVAALPDPA